MLPGVCQDLYNKINYIQSKLIDQEIQLIVQLQKPYKCVIKKQFLHIYRDDVPVYSLALCFPSIIHWEVKEQINGFRLRDSYQSDESHKIKKLLDGRVFYTKVQDFYEPIEVLGKGSQAKVLLVRCRLTENLFAAKCIPINEISFQEIEINRLLKHKAFCKLYEVFQGQTSYYIVMERLSGKNLMEIMRKQTVNLEQVKKIMKVPILQQIFFSFKNKDLLEGLDYMHKLNIMHRDLKPENLVLHKSTDETLLKIVDFGLATYSTLKKYKYPKCGTPGYVAPEVCNYSGGHYGTKCDIFSAGCIFYLLLTGKHLFSGQGYNFVLEQNKICKIDLQLISNSYPQYLFNLVQSMLFRDPRARPTAEECLQNQFFQKQKPTTSQRKAMFQQAKTCNQTMEFNQEKIDQNDSLLTNDMVQYGLGGKNALFNTKEFEV